MAQTRPSAHPSGPEERVDHFIETYYRAAAQVFYFSHGEGGSKEYEERKARDSLENLKKIGVTVNADAKTVSKVVDLQKRLERGSSKTDWAERIADLEDPDFIAKQDMMHYAKLFSMSDKEFEDDVKLQRELRDLLRSELVEVPTK